MALAIFVFIFGLIWGSFLNVLLFRLDKKPGILTGRSECPNCKSTLKWFDLIPVLSFICLKGRCRYCNAKISPLYPVVELSLALLFVLYVLFNRNNPPVSMGFAFFNIFVLTAIFFFDLLYYEIPDKIVLPAAAIALLYTVIADRGDLAGAISAGFIMAGFFAILFIVSKGGWVGFGDAKMSLYIGILLQYPLGPVSLIISVWIAAIIGLILIASKAASLKTELPFGTFFTATTVIFLIFRPYVMDLLNSLIWYG